MGLDLIPDWRIGASVALTGPEAVYGAQIREALLLAFEDAGVPPACLVVEDDGSDEARAKTAAVRLTAETGVLAVIGPMNSWTCAVQGPLYQDAGLAHITPSASNPDLSERGWTTYFSACASDRIQARVLAEVAVGLLAARRVAAVHDGTTFGAKLAERFLAESSRHGLEARVDAAVRDGDHASIAQAAMVVASAAADVVLVVGLEAPCGAAALALRAHGVTATLLGTDAIKPTRVLVTPGSGSVGPYLTNSGTDAARLAAPLHQRMTARCGHHHSIYTVEAYDAARFLLSIIHEQGAGDRGAVLRALRTQRHAGLSGPLQFGPSGERLDPSVGIYRYEGDTLVYLGSHHRVLGVRA